MIWNDVLDGTEDEFLHWHVHEHIPERVILPGFTRGRRYDSIDGNPAFFNFYETQTVADLNSEAYRVELDRPSEWTKSVVSRFTGTSRTVCEVVRSAGSGEGAVIETIRLGSVADPETFGECAVRDLLMPALEQRGIVGVHLLRGQTGVGSVQTAEMRLRGGVDEIASWVILIEAVRPEAIFRLRDGLLSEARLVAAGAGTDFKRGAYTVQFSLSRGDLERSGFRVPLRPVSVSGTTKNPTDGKRP